MKSSVWLRETAAFFFEINRQIIKDITLEVSYKTLKTFASYFIHMTLVFPYLTLLAYGSHMVDGTD